MTGHRAPEALRLAVEQWKAAGAHQQPPSRWSPGTWQSWFPEYATFLPELPQPISRADVIARCRAASEGPEEATKAFIAAMIWGYGPVGYGAYRTKRVLTESDGAGETLATAAAIARDQGGPAAFEWLASRENRLRYLGVAFATKYLFFCAAQGDGPPALVLDRLVRGWLAKTLDWSMNLEWDVADYRDYIDRMSEWAAALDIEPGNLEMLVFQLAANGDANSLWSAPELFTSAPPESISEVTDEIGDFAAAILDKLNDAAALFAAQPGAIDPEDVADFDQGMRQLKRIVLTNY